MISRAQFFRGCRLLHGWLSAAAFLILIFFAATGLALNHPEWRQGSHSKTIETSFLLSAADEAELGSAADVPRVLVNIASARVALVGAFKSGEVDGDKLYAHMEGAKGFSDLRADRRQHRVDVSIDRASALSLLNELHRAEHAGAAWRFVVDLAAVLLLATSLVGYVIFLGLRLQLRTALAVTTASGVILLSALLWLTI